VPDLVVPIDDDGIIRYVSPAVERETGWRSDRGRYRAKSTRDSSICWSPN
jgi:hypothetical protein